jgi:hypothetical protein
MNRESCGKFDLELLKLIDYFRMKYTLSNAEAIGVLALAQARILRDVIKKEEED